MKNIFNKIIIIAIIGGVSVLGWYIFTSPSIPTENIITRNGLHWHSKLSIYINGEQILIPTNIGVNGPMGAGGDPMELHTHTPDGVIHAEFTGIVTKEHLKLKNFFKIWKKDFSRDSILGNKAENGKQIIFSVNGQPNDLFEEYSFFYLF